MLLKSLFSFYPGSGSPDSGTVLFTFRVSAPSSENVLIVKSQQVDKINHEVWRPACQIAQDGAGRTAQQVKALATLDNPSSSLEPTHTVEGRSLSPKLSFNRTPICTLNKWGKIKIFTVCEDLSYQKEKHLMNSKCSVSLFSGCFLYSAMLILWIGVIGGSCGNNSPQLIRFILKTTDVPTGDIMLWLSTYNDFQAAKYQGFVGVVFPIHRFT